MPNGGTDNCATCWFNSGLIENPGTGHSIPEANVICTIRNLKIENSFYTYCSNHQKHNFKKVVVPIGPVYVHNDDGRYEYREIWINTVDNEETRILLLSLVDEIQEVSGNEYPAGFRFDEEVIRQIYYLNEKRAIPKLQRILNFNPFSYPDEDNHSHHNRIKIIGLALGTFSKLTGIAAINNIKES